MIPFCSLFTEWVNAFKFALTLTATWCTRFCLLLLHSPETIFQVFSVWGAQIPAPPSPSFGSSSLLSLYFSWTLIFVFPTYSIAQVLATSLPPYLEEEMSLLLSKDNICPLLALEVLETILVSLSYFVLFILEPAILLSCIAVTLFPKGAELIQKTGSKSHLFYLGS